MNQTGLFIRETATEARPVTLRRAESFLRKKIDQPFNSRALTIAASTSERSIQILFKKTYGVSPRTWFEHIRLKAAREDLLQANKEQTPVIDVATRWGFFHHGRFSAKYRRLFGGSPSATLADNHSARVTHPTQLKTISKYARKRKF
jgi:transcriptional regulator GlxA family with amidase domain